ncbi:MAG: hypothetical protein H7257_14070, partial [Taibaiella sp.]|nr:hypothetical protein [Taibaiella sp.]
SYSEYQNPNPTDYKTTVGYLFTKYYPTGNGLNTFPFHNYFAADTFILRIGAPTRFYSPTGAFRSARADSPKISVAIYQ